jgi:hypothetical protein
MIISLKSHWQHWAHKTQDEDNPEPLAALKTNITKKQHNTTDCPFFIACSVFFNVYLLTRVLHFGQTYTCTAL